MHSGDEANASLPRGLAFASLNLRHNPFGELDLEQRAESAVVDVAPLLRELRRPRTAVQLLGDKGFGKTTHLLAVRRELPSAVYLYFPERGPHPALPRPTAAAGPLLLDETQRLCRRQWRRALRPGRSLAVATHLDHTELLGRWGYRVVSLEVAARTTTERLLTCFRRRIELARRGPGPLPELGEARVSELRARFGADVRSMLLDLYDEFQRREARQREIQQQHAQPKELPSHA